MARCMDSILIQHLEVAAIIGVYEQERHEAQRLLIDMELSVDLRPAGHSDHLHETVDYAALVAEVTTLASASRFALIEKLATAIAEHCLTHRRVDKVRVRIHKPEVPLAAAIAVEIIRQRHEQA